MQIEAGKYYKTRDGRKVGPMAANDNDMWPWIVKGSMPRTGFAWKQDGIGCSYSPHSEYDTNLDLIAEWTDTPAEPKLWRDMTPEEKGALLLAHHEGNVIEGWMYGDKWTPIDADWSEHNAYRVKPNPVVETVTLYGSVLEGFSTLAREPQDTHRITFNLVNGNPDPASIKMEELT